MWAYPCPKRALSQWTPNIDRCSLHVCVEQAARGGEGQVVILSYTLLTAGFLTLVRRLQEWGPGTSDPVCMLMVIGQGSPCLPFLQPQRQGLSTS